MVKATVGFTIGLIGKLGDQPNFAKLGHLPDGLLFGVWLTAVISFVILAAVVYFLVVMPYTAAKERYFPSAAPGTPEDIKLLQEIRDLLAAQQGRPPTRLVSAPWCGGTCSLSQSSRGRSRRAGGVVALVGGRVWQHVAEHLGEPTLARSQSDSRAAGAVLAHAEASAGERRRRWRQRPRACWPVARRRGVRRRPAEGARRRARCRAGGRR